MLREWMVELKLGNFTMTYPAVAETPTEALEQAQQQLLGMATAVVTPKN